MWYIYMLVFLLLYQNLFICTTVHSFVSYPSSLCPRIQVHYGQFFPFNDFAMIVWNWPYLSRTFLSRNVQTLPLSCVLESQVKHMNKLTSVWRTSKKDKALINIFIHSSLCKCMSSFSREITRSHTSVSWRFTICFKWLPKCMSNCPFKHPP